MVVKESTSGRGLSGKTNPINLASPNVKATPEITVIM